MSKVIADIRAELAAKPLPGGLFHRARRTVPGAGAGGQTDHLAGAGVADDDLHGALQPLPLDGADPDHHGQHSAGADRQRDRLWISGQPLSVAALVGFIT
jgi:hypothetical protein